MMAGRLTSAAVAESLGMKHEYLGLTRVAAE
jgi:hypothetical protein